MYNFNFKSLIISTIIFTLLQTPVKCAKANTSQKRKFALVDMLELEESTIVKMKAAWNITNDIYYTGAVNITTAKMLAFSLKLLSIFSEINEGFKVYERRVIFMQPDQLMNVLIDLKELEPLTILSDTRTDDPVAHWKVKWVEVSSLTTQIHWLYSKRILDILTSVPYIKTIATSISKYYGNPWNSILSGRTVKERRVPMRYNARLIEERMFSIPAGDLFFGLRKLLNDSKTGKSGSSVKAGTCSGDNTIGKILPIRLETPLYVLFYLCLVDFKFYILENYFQIYREAYEGNLFANYSSSDDRLRKRVRRKIDSYNASFGDYKGGGSEKKIMSGYFHCDPPSVDPSGVRNHTQHDTFIKFTNFLTVFVELEKTLSPSGQCGGTCQAFGKAKDFCKSTDPKCTADLHPECEKDPALCKKFTPPCPIKDLTCFTAGMKATTCHSDDDTRMYEWVDLDGTAFGPKIKGTDCEQWTSDFSGTTEPVGGKNENCEVCLCQCLEPILIQGNTSSVRTFSMKGIVSRVDENRVIVGFKFVQIADQLHFMIADAVSTPGFMVDKSTISWITPTAADELKSGETKRLSKTLKTFHLDDVKAPEGAVVTGIKFIDKPKLPLAADNMNQQMYIGFAIQTTMLDPTTGDLDSSSSNWVEYPSVGTPGQYNYVDPDNPVKADGPAVPDSSVDQFIDFRASSFKKDAGQTVIPFFDAQKIILAETKEAYALRGVGIFHRQKPMFGGFLGIKILPYGEYNPF